MDWQQLVSSLLTLGLVIYLTFALLFPEKFS